MTSCAQKLVLPWLSLQKQLWCPR